MAWDANYITIGMMGLRPDLQHWRISDDPLDEPIWIEVGGASGMRAWAVHAVFAVILICSHMTRERAVDALADRVSLEPAVLRVAGSHRWGIDDYRTTNGIVSRALVFEAPGCSQPVFVTLRLSSFEEGTIMQYTAQPGYVRRYIYFDRTRDTPYGHVSVTFGPTPQSRDLLRLAADAPRRARHEPPFPRLRRGDRLVTCRGPARPERLSRRAAADVARGFA